MPLRVAYQGEPGAYSEKSTRELLGDKVFAIGRPNFEACYQAVVDKEVDYLCVPVENSLGGSIHENFDLMLRYDLTIVAEHEFRVHHCFLVKPGVKQGDIKYAISHSQALAQCDGYLRSLGIKPVPTYDTAGSAKMISDAILDSKDQNIDPKDKRKLPPGCTPENTVAIASDLAGEIYGLECLAKGIEDDDSNFTRFLLMGRKGVAQYLEKGIPAKTSLVFTLTDKSGALYKALACFSLRDIDMSKIESRPMSASLLHFLQFRSQVDGRKARLKTALPRFRYCFYLDILASELDEDTQNAIHHLREQSDFCRVLGSYPRKSRLVGPVLSASEKTKKMNVARDQTSLRQLPNDVSAEEKLKIGIIGYGNNGRFFSEKMVEKHEVSCIDLQDKSKEASELGVEYFPMFDMISFLKNLDVVVLAVPLVEFEDMVASLPMQRLRGKLVVELCPTGKHPKSVLLKYLPEDVDIICTSPMFGPASSSSSWDGLPFVYEKVRTGGDFARAKAFLSIFDQARCRMVEMTGEQIDAQTADAEFMTHLTGRLLDKKIMAPTLVASKEYAALLDVAEMTANDTFEEFYGLFKYNENASTLMNAMRDNLAKVERQLAAKEAYLAAKSEMKNDDRLRLLKECETLMREVAKNNGVIESATKKVSTSSSSEPKAKGLKKKPKSSVGVTPSSE
eukprot:CAMPEP_0195511502 /NCGR_PEP_ID=MMETSP0794_2-20130614/3792_1 /TAXON_ID=515487 /ORGANISM="Stephanopyxis turris, Strain CCMP 815" /LENGTH=677 /DNA_ID=CAMNT_0040639103 /DNA_START=247 /DNA_END=2280 /DNA_ORIENTATION=+